MKKLLKKWKNEKGQSVVEMALVLPLLLLIICGIIDFGWLFYNSISVNNCAREGARYATIKAGTTGADQLIRDRVVAIAPNGIKSSVTTTITYSNLSDPKQGDVTITVSANIPVLTPVVGVFYKDQVVPVHSKTTMKVG